MRGKSTNNNNNKSNKTFSTLQLYITHFENIVNTLLRLGSYIKFNIFVAYIFYDFFCFELFYNTNYCKHNKYKNIYNILHIHTWFDVHNFTNHNTYLIHDFNYTQKL